MIVKTDSHVNYPAFVDEKQISVWIPKGVKCNRFNHEHPNISPPSNGFRLRQAANWETAELLIRNSGGDPTLLESTPLWVPDSAFEESPGEQQLKWDCILDE